MTGSYVAVPVPVWQDQPDSVVRSILSAPVPQKGAVHQQARAGASLGYSSITYTPSKQTVPLLSKLIEISRKNQLLPDSYAFMIDSFYKWAVITENYWVSVKTIKPGCKCIPGKYWGYSFDAKPLHNRFSNPRRLRKLAQVYEIMRYEEKEETKEYTLLSLTAAHEGGWRKTMDRLIFGRNHLLMILRKYMPGIRYVWVAEPHPDKDKLGGDVGYPHFHLVLPQRVDNTVKDSQGRGLEDKLREYWDTKWGIGSHTYGLDFEVIEDSDKALNYILKYVGKSFTNERGWSAAELIFNANLYGAMSDEENPVVYRTFGMCNEYNRLFPHPKKEPSVCLDARLFPIEESDPETGQEYPIKAVWERPQLIPDWLFNIDLIDSILKGSPDYTTRPKYDEKGKAIWKEREKHIDDTPRTPEEWRRYRKMQADGYL